MRKAAFLVLLAVLSLMLSSCAVSRQPEHLAYAISLGIDKTDTGEIMLSVQIPTIGGEKSGSSEEGSFGGEATYVLNTATAATFSQALDLLQATVSRTLELSQLKSIVISQELATTPEFNQLIEDMMMTYRLSTAAYMVITLGEAREMVVSQSPSIGTRLSTGVTAALEHYHQQGYIPRVRLADVYYAMKSIYSDPVCILAATADEKNYRAMPDGRLGDGLPGTLPRSGPNKNEYFGCALIGEDRMVGLLDGEQSRWLSVLNGEIGDMSYICGGESLDLLLAGKPSVRVDLSGDAPRIDVGLTFTVASLHEQPDLNQLRALIESDLSNLVKQCQSLNVEPFGFSEYVAMQFPTTQAYTDYHWKERFPSAQCHFEISFKD